MNISLTEDIQPISYVKSNMNKVLQKSKKSGRPVIVTQNGKAAGVVIDIAIWEGFLKKMSLTQAILEAEVSIRNEDYMSIGELKDKLGV